MHGYEKLHRDLPTELQFYASTVHYADLTAGASGRTAALGMQLAQRGLPNVLRGTTADFNTDGRVDGSDFLAWQRHLGSRGAIRAQGDATSDGVVNANDLALWKSMFGFSVAESQFDADYFAPMNAAADNSEVLLGPTLPGLLPGELIDQHYALGDGTDEQGLITRELEFALPIDAGDPTNSYKRRNMDNIVNLQMAIDNSNVGGVSGEGPYDVPTTGDPENVTTGIEFSIPLADIGYETGPIKITIFLNNGNHDYLANQISGEGVLFSSLAFLLPDFELEFPGAQYVTVAAPVAPAISLPEPSTMTLLGVACGWFAQMRRKRRVPG